MSRSKQDRAEIPCGTGFVPTGTGGPSLSDTTTLWDAHREPINEYDALMRCDFDQYPVECEDSTFLVEMEALLTPKEKAVIGFLVYGGMSLYQTGRYLGAEFPRKGVPTPYSKMTVSNLRDSALAKMRNYLETQNDPF